MSSAEVERLTTLLQKAADAIRTERAQQEGLRRENESLRKQVEALEAQLKSGGGGGVHVHIDAAANGSPSVADSSLLRQQLLQVREDNRLLTMENDIAVRQIAQLREENARLRMDAAAAATFAEPTISMSQGRTHSARSVSPFSGNMNTSGARPNTANAAHRSNSAPKQQNSSPRSSSQHHRSHSSDLFAKLQARARGSASISAVMHPPNPSGVNQNTSIGTNLHPGGSHVNLAREPSAMANSYAYDKGEQALNRMRRSLAPPPTKEQLDEVIRAMVSEIQAQLQKKGLKLHMRRVRECCYESGKKRFNLSVDSNRLMVKCGGGNVDFLEYIDRNKLCESTR